jgi:hypothetical protein
LKFRVCNYVWTWGTYDDIETAINVAKMVIDDEGYDRILIRNNDTDEIIHTVRKVA